MFNMLSTLADPSIRQQLEQFQFIPRWNTLSQSEKLKYFDKFSCHEVNVFLKFKDPEFFASIVKPFLMNKFDKTFVDLWLIGEDITHFDVTPLIDSLNAMELGILASQLKGENQAKLLANLHDHAEVKQIDASGFEKIFATCMRRQEDDNGSREPPRPPQRGYEEGQASLLGVNQSVSNDRIPADIAGKLEEILMRTGKIDNLVDKCEDLKLQAELFCKKSQTVKMTNPASSRRKSGSTSHRINADEEMSLRQEVMEQGLLYKSLDPCDECDEMNYYRIAHPDATLIPISQFWYEFALHMCDVDHCEDEFISSHVLECVSSFTEIICALSVVSLPFSIPRSHVEDDDGCRLLFTASAPMLLLHKQLADTESKCDGSVIVAQQYFDPAKNGSDDSNHYIDVSSSSLIPAHHYCFKIIVTNISSHRKTCYLLAQIPEGSYPIEGTPISESIPIKIEPYQTFIKDYHFYFPRVGVYSHYPAHVSQDSTLVGYASCSVLRVDEPQSVCVDTSSWSDVAKRGTIEEIMDYLRKSKILKLDFDLLSGRMTDRQNFSVITSFLRGRGHFFESIWRYSVYHKDVKAIVEYLVNFGAILGRLGPLRSRVLCINDYKYHHLEYSPFVNSRVHALKTGEQSTILNKELKEQYMHFLVRMIPEHDDASEHDHMEMCYYLLLQDRVKESFSHYLRSLRAPSIDECTELFRARHPLMTIQSSYFLCYFAFYMQRPDIALAIAHEYADYPVERYKRLFKSIVEAVSHAEAATAGMLATQGASDVEVASEQSGDAFVRAAPSVSMELDGDALVLSVINSATVLLSFYLIDVETLFSFNPFLFSSQRMDLAAIVPDSSCLVDVPANVVAFKYSIPIHYAGSDMIITASFEGDCFAQTVSVTKFHGLLTVHPITEHGLLRVVDTVSLKPVIGAYVKVYEKSKGGVVKFYKDGYTDLCGSFDYASLSGMNLSVINSFSILVHSATHGSVVTEVKPPPN